ncbi:MAG: hypothetical protein FOGNACKC_00308 [Anaerolineae bacterium]|nr:hypothetical protein [Anaerolineae bacterium]
MEIIKDFALAFDAQSYIDLRGEQFARLMAQPSRRAQLDAAIDAIGQIATPAACYTIFPIKKFLHERLQLANGVLIGGGPVVQVVGGAEALVVAVCTVGAGVDRKLRLLQIEKQLFQTMLFDELASWAVDQVRQQLYRQVEARQQAQGWRLSTLLSPGESSWSMRDQATIFKLIDAAAIGVTLNSSGVMQPLKSLSMIMGTGSCQMGVEGLTNCDFCSLKDRCRYSRTRPGGQGHPVQLV